MRLIEEFLAKSRTTRCSDFADACEKVAKVGFKMFLNVTATVTDWNANKTECSLVRGTGIAGKCAVTLMPHNR